MKEFQLEGEDSSAELLETTVANEMAETGRCNSGINSFAVVDPGLALFLISLGTKWESHLETKLEGCQLFLLHCVFQSAALGKTRCLA